MLCAYVNNNMRCYNESTDFADTMEDALEPGCKASHLEACLPRQAVHPYQTEREIVLDPTALIIICLHCMTEHLIEDSNL